MLSAKLINEVESKAGKIVSLRTAWTQAIGKAIDSDLDEDLVVLVVRVFAAPSSLIKLVETIGNTGSADQEALVRQVEQYAFESDFSVNEWFQALEKILQYLIKHNRSSELKILLGYMSCSAEYLSTTTGLLSFADGVDAFLEEFGFDG